MENNFLNDLQKWNDESLRNNEENNSKNQSKEKEFLTERLNVRLTKSELEMLKQKSTLTGESIAKLIRLGIKNVEGFKIILPNAEENKMLIEYRTNFSRIKNHFESQLWNKSEREFYKKLLENTIFKIDKYLQK